MERKAYLSLDRNTRWDIEYFRSHDWIFQSRIFYVPYKYFKGLKVDLRTFCSKRDREGLAFADLFNPYLVSPEIEEDAEEAILYEDLDYDHPHFRYYNAFSCYPIPNQYLYIRYLRNKVILVPYELIKDNIKDGILREGLQKALDEVDELMENRLDTPLYREELPYLCDKTI